ncbi:hypothetical protein EDB19DRAFT_1665778 [Suillus lakei]|nr:hypothetical protein EDB19DRAFT_1665778 [Suillus lakei]
MAYGILLSGDAADLGLLTPNHSGSSSIVDSPPGPNATLSASSSSSTTQGPAPQSESTAADEEEEAPRPRRNLGKQKETYDESQPESIVEHQLRGSGGPPPQVLYGPQPGFYPPHYPPPPPLPQPQPPHFVPQPPPVDQAHLNADGPSTNAMYGMANPGFGAGYGPPGMPAQMGHFGFPLPSPPAPHVPQGPIYQWVPVPPYHHPPPQHYGAYPGPQAMAGAPHYGPPVEAVPGPSYVNPQVTIRQDQDQFPPEPPAFAIHGYPPPIADNVNHHVPAHAQGQWQAPMAHWAPPAPPAQSNQGQQFHQPPMPQVPLIGQAEGTTRRNKRKAVDDGDRQKKTNHKRISPHGNPDFAPVQQPDGTLRWKCLKDTCASVQPMLEASVHNHVRKTKTHTDGSSEPRVPCPGCGFTFYDRGDSLNRHIRSKGQCIRNQAKTQANFLAPPVATQGNGGPLPSLRPKGRLHLRSRGESRLSPQWGPRFMGQLSLSGESSSMSGAEGKPGPGVVEQPESIVGAEGQPAYGVEEQPASSGADEQSASPGPEEQPAPSDAEGAPSFPVIASSFSIFDCQPSSPPSDSLEYLFS